MEIEFKDIGRLIGEYQLWFLIPFIIAMIGIFIGLAINVYLMKKRRKKSERSKYARTRRTRK